MEIIKNSWKWNSPLQKRKSTLYIILHHSATISESVETVERSHKNNGWSGIGYHFYIRKDGSVYEGRPIDTIGAHTENYNSVSVGVCFEGNYETEQTMPEAQKKAGNELIKYILKNYPNLRIKKHKDFNSTACPGKYFPFDEILNYVDKPVELTSVNDIVWELSHRGIISDTNLWLKKLEDDVNAYWLARKTIKHLMSKGV